jgi:hypothetical protein
VEVGKYTPFPHKGQLWKHNYWDQLTSILPWWLFFCVIMSFLLVISDGKWGK